MKKLLLLLCGFSLLSGTYRAQAQSFATQSGAKDTVNGFWDGTDELSITNYIKSASSNSIYVKWHVTGYSLAPNWTIGGFCDNNTCYLAPTVVAGTNFVSNAYTQSYGDFHVIFDGLNAAQMGSFSYVKANVKDTISGTSRNLTFIGYKNTLGVGSVITSYDDITIFPNPAREAVNVIFNEKAGVRTIAIYNLIGKIMNVYKPTDSGSAKLDIDNIPAGVYFLRLMDGQGHILATRRFTRQ